MKQKPKNPKINLLPAFKASKQQAHEEAKKTGYKHFDPEVMQTIYKYFPSMKEFHEQKRKQFFSIKTPERQAIEAEEIKMQKLKNTLFSEIISEQLMKLGFSPEETFKFLSEKTTNANRQDKAGTALKIWDNSNLQFEHPGAFEHLQNYVWNQLKKHGKLKGETRFRASMTSIVDQAIATAERKLKARFGL